MFLQYLLEMLFSPPPNIANNAVSDSGGSSGGNMTGLNQSYNNQPGFAGLERGDTVRERTDHSRDGRRFDNNSGGNIINNSGTRRIERDK